MLPMSLALIILAPSGVLTEVVSYYNRLSSHRSLNVYLAAKYGLHHGAQHNCCADNC